MTELDKSKLPIILRLTAALTSLVFLAGLSGFAYSGTFSRLWTDDFCYSNEIQQYGVFYGTLDWLQTGGNRFSALWGVALSDIFGVYAARWLPALLLLAWVLAAWWFIRGLARFFQIHVPPMLSPLLALGLVFIAAFAAPHRLQTIYWRMGSLHYSLPLVLFLFMASLTLRAWPAKGQYLRMPEVAVVTTLGAFIAAGLSETYAAFQTGILGLALMAVLFLMKSKSWQTGLPLLAGPLLGSLAGMAVMAFAPANAWRQALLPPPDNFGIFLQYTLRYSFDFAVQMLSSVPIPLIILVSLAAASGLWVGFSQKSSHLFLAGAIVLLVSFGLVVCAIAPSVYAGLQYPTGRALNVAWFALILGMGTTGLVWAAGLRQVLHRLPVVVWTAAAALVFLLCCAYGLRSLPSILDEANQMQVWSVRWDARHQSILAQRVQGIQDVVVPEIEVVRSLEDIGPDTDHWVNTCTAGYYQIDSIQALP